MTFIRRFAAITTALLVSPLAVDIALAGGDITVTGAWARPSLGQTGVTALYLTLKNNGPQPDELLSVTTPLAKVSELHSSRVENGVVTMQPIGRLPLPPGQTVVFEPKGNHVMLMMLSRPLTAGEHLALELRFAFHAPESAEAVIAIAPPPQP